MKDKNKTIRKTKPKMTKSGRKIGEIIESWVFNENKKVGDTTWMGGDSYEILEINENGIGKLKRLGDMSTAQHEEARKQAAQFNRDHKGER